MNLRFGIFRSPDLWSGSFTGKIGVLKVMVGSWPDSRTLRDSAGMYGCRHVDVAFVKLKKLSILVMVQLGFATNIGGILAELLSL